MPNRVPHRASILLALALTTGACQSPEPAAPDLHEVIVLEHSDAASIARVLEKTLEDRPGPTARIVADVRTNSLVLAGSDEAIARVKDLVVQLDREVN